MSALRARDRRAADSVTCRTVKASRNVGLGWLRRCAGRQAAPQAVLCRRDAV